MTTDNDTGQIELYQAAEGEVAKKDPTFLAWLLRFVATVKGFFDNNNARLSALEARVQDIEDEM